MNASFFEVGKLKNCFLKIELISRFWNDFYIRITQNDTSSEFQIGKLDRETRKLFIMNLRRFCSLFINFGTNESYVDVEGLLLYFNAPFNDLDINYLEEQMVKDDSEDGKFMADWILDLVIYIVSQIIITLMATVHLRIILTVPTLSV